MNYSPGLLTVLSLCALALVRNRIVYRVRLRRLAEIHAANVAELESEAPEDLARWRDRFRKYRAETYNSMVLDLRKWKYEDFYKDPP